MIIYKTTFSLLLTLLIIGDWSTSSCSQDIKLNHDNISGNNVNKSQELQQDLVYVVESSSPLKLDANLTEPVSLAPQSSVVKVTFPSPRDAAELNIDVRRWFLKGRTGIDNKKSNQTNKQSQEFDTGRPITSVISAVGEFISSAFSNVTLIPPISNQTSTTEKPSSTTQADIINQNDSSTQVDPNANVKPNSNEEDTKDPNGPVGTKTTRTGSSVSCGEANPSGQSDKRLTHRIIGGHKTEPGEFPFQVRLNIRSKRGSGVCGGVVYNENTILTAAHCMTSCASQHLITATIEKSGVHATIGDHSIKSEDGESDVEIEEIKPHEKYDACNFYSNDHDIAVIRTKQRMDYRFTTDGYGSINRPCMPNEQNVTYADGERVIVSGWGVTRENSGSLSNILRYVQIPVVNTTRCQDTYGSRVTTQHICAGFESGGMDSCQGDSGGPLVRVVENRYELVGIVSFGYGCGLPGAPGVYTRVASYMDWIKANS